MAPILTTVLPLQLVCHLVALGVENSASNSTTNINVNLQQSSSEFAKLPEGYIAHPEIGTAYKIHNESVSRKVAKERCRSEGGILAVIDSRKKYDYADIHRTFNDSIHVGISRFEDSWISVTDGSVVATIPWADEEPNGCNNCAYMSWNRGGIANFNCNWIKPYICEIPIPVSDRVPEINSGSITWQ